MMEIVDIDLSKLSEETKTNLKNALIKTLKKNLELFNKETIEYGYRREQITTKKRR